MSYFIPKQVRIVDFCHSSNGSIPIADCDVDSTLIMSYDTVEQIKDVEEAIKYKETHENMVIVMDTIISNHPRAGLTILASEYSEPVVEITPNFDCHIDLSELIRSGCSIVNSIILDEMIFVLNVHGSSATLLTVKSDLVQFLMNQNDDIQYSKIERGQRYKAISSNDGSVNNYTFLGKFECYEINRIGKILPVMAKANGVFSRYLVLDESNKRVIDFSADTGDIAFSGTLLDVVSLTHSELYEYTNSRGRFNYLHIAHDDKLNMAKSFGVYTDVEFTIVNSELSASEPPDIIYNKLTGKGFDGGNYCSYYINEVILGRMFDDFHSDFTPVERVKEYNNSIGKYGEWISSKTDKSNPFLVNGQVIDVSELDFIEAVKVSNDMCTMFVEWANKGELGLAKAQTLITTEKCNSFLFNR